MRRPQPPATLARLAVSSLCGIALLISVAGLAHAERDPGYPSAAQVAGAMAAVTDVAQQVEALDAELSASRDTMARLEDTAAVAAMASNGARIVLEQRTRASTTARMTAAAAQGRSEEASFALSSYAAGVFQQGSGNLAPLEVFFGGNGPQDVLDRAESLETVGGERARILDEAEATKLLAQSLQRAAAEAQVRQDTAAAAAEAAAQKAWSDSQHAASEANRLTATEQDLVRQLADLRKTSAAMESLRQAGLVAAEQARREEAARQAGLAAAAEAAQRAADAAAAEQAATAAAERSARSAREVAAAGEAVKAADALRAADAVKAADALRAAARQTSPQTAQLPPTPRSAAATPILGAPSAPTVPSPPPATAPVPPPSGTRLNTANADMWDRIAVCESGGDWHINTGNGYYGGLQFDSRTWLGAGGGDFASRADLASREQQITVANRVYAQRGLAPWACGYAGL